MCLTSCNNSTSFPYLIIGWYTLTRSSISKSVKTMKTHLQGTTKYKTAEGRKVDKLIHAGLEICG